MEITEVRVALREPVASGVPSSVGDGRGGERRLKAYATLTFDNCFVVRNIKIIEGKNGLFVAMPSRKPKAVCPSCGFKGEIGGRYCIQCGSPIPRQERAPDSELTEGQTHRDIAHPITAEFRQYLQQKVLEVYDTERAKGQAVGSAGMADDVG